MKDAVSQFEIIPHTQLPNLNFFIADLSYCAPHYHNDIEIILVIDGSLHVETASENYSVSRGCVVLFNTHEFHSLRSVGSHCVVLCIQTNPAFCAAYYPAISNLRFDTSNITSVFQANQSSYISETCYNLGYNYYSQMQGFELRCMSDLYRLFGDLIAAVPNHTLTTSQMLQSTKDSQRIARITEYISGHYKEKISLAAIAEMEKLSVSYLSHMIKKYIKMSFQEYVNTMRFEYAVTLLKSTDMGLTDIAIASGFSDIKYLNKIFQQTYNTSSTSFRQTLKSSAAPLVQYSFSDSQLHTYDAENGLKILKQYHRYKDNISENITN